MDMHQSFDACFFGSRNEYIDATGMVTQNVVGTSADKQTRLFFSQFTYYVALYFEQSVIAQTTAIGNGSVADKRKTCSEQTADNALRSFFICFFKEFLAQAALF